MYSVAMVPPSPSPAKTARSPRRTSRVWLAALGITVVVVLVVIINSPAGWAPPRPFAALPGFPGLTPLPTPTVPTQMFNVMNYGAHADGVTDDRSAITACAKAAVAAGGAVYFPAGTYRLTGILSAVPGAFYYAPSGVTLRTQDDIFGANNCTFDGFTFQSYGSAIGVSTGESERISNMTVENCTFAAGTAEYTHARILLYLAASCLINHNTFVGTSGSGGNIQVCGGGCNQITNNVIRGGMTAILFMWSRRPNGGGAASIIQGNVVSGNTCSGYSREGISFDSNAGSPSGTDALEYDTIAGVSGQTITLSNLAFPNYVGYDIVFIDGNLRGHTRTITAESGHTFTVSGSLAGAAAGDHVTIGACYKANYIGHNVGLRPLGSDPFSAVLLYGLCFGNVVEYNTASSARSRWTSLDSRPCDRKRVTGTHGRAPNGYNTIQDNTVQASTGRVDLQYYALGGSYTPSPLRATT